MRALAHNAFRTQERLADGEIDQAKADLLLHGQELALNNILIYSEFLTYELAQDVLDAVFGVLTAAFKNLTGIKINF